MPDGQAASSALPPDRRAPRSPDDPSATETLGEYVELGLDDDDMETQEAEDGGLYVTIGKPFQQRLGADTEEFYTNLAEEDGIPDHMLTTLSAEIMRHVQEDIEARKPRDEQYEEGIRRTGLGKDAPGGAEFEGASKVVHPMITEACIDLESRVIKELWPPVGPVKERIVGSVTRRKSERARRKVDHMNWQLRTQIKEAFPVTENALMQTGLGGGSYIKQIWDHRLKRPRWYSVTVDKVILPFGAADFYSSHRRTVSETVSNVEFKERIAQGVYRDHKLPAIAMAPEPTKAQSAAEKVEGVTDPGINLDGEREIYETMTYLEVTDEMAPFLDREDVGTLYPYLISIEKESGKVLSMYRDWEEDDETRQPIDHVFEIPFIPWRGAYSIGFTQMIGGLSGGATGALRALLDSALVNNTPGGLIMKGSGTTAQTRRPNPGEFAELDTSLETDDIRKRVMPFTFNQPSPVLYQLLGFLVDAGKGTVRTSLDETTVNSNANTPVGTQLSRVEEGMVVFSSIHGRVHQAFNRILMGLHRLNALYLPETLRVDADGREIMVYRKDYQGPVDVQPVSDPTIFSDQQRYAQDAAIQQRSAQVPGLYKLREVEKRWLKRMKIGDDEIDNLLTDQPSPHELNAANENLALLLGRPVVAFPEQDHLAHLQAHLEFLESPIFGSNPLVAPKYLPGALSHIVEHLGYAYVSATHDTITKAAGTKATLLLSTDDKVKRRFDQLIALASGQSLTGLNQQLQGVIPILMKAQQTLQKLQPPPSLDPGQAAVQAATAETNRRGQADQMNAKQDQAELQQKTQQAQAETAVDWAKVDAMKDNAQLNAQVKQQTTGEDNDTAMSIAEMRVNRGQPAGFSTGESLTRE